jgi:nitrous oxide reductase accessory protein NosL
VKPHVLALGVAALLAGGGGGRSGEAGFVPPGERDRCPVCGMFVARYPDWIAEVRFADGGYAVFDGAKDLFKFLAAPGRYLPGRAGSEVRAIWVTDYYAVRPVDGRAAHFVLGSDVLGPMGRELVPFACREEAEEFRRDHHGTRVLRFEEVTADVLAGLDG